MAGLKIVQDFLDVYGIKVSENEDCSYVELMMDNHKCVEYNGVKYYIPEDTAYSIIEQSCYDLLVEKYLV